MRKLARGLQKAAGLVATMSPPENILYLRWESDTVCRRSSENWTRCSKAKGWEFDHATGSHYIYVHPADGSISVPFHGSNNEIAQGTLKAILKQAGLR